MEDAHCATAGEEQNGAKHFIVARRSIVTCFRARYDRFWLAFAKENSKS